MLKIAAIMCLYNESEIILDCVENLKIEAIDCFVLDDNSTDNTRELIASRLDKEVSGIVRINNGKHRDYSQSRNMRAVEKLSKLLEYDWYIYLDADEIRLGPHHAKSLRESIQMVNDQGYSLINFKVYNFRPTIDDIANENDYRLFTHYEEAGDFDSRQIKAWKSNESVDLHTYAGHLPVFSSPQRLFPTRFILKHYPIRSPHHFTRKILNERKNRFSIEERSRGWHVQYDTMANECPVWHRENLIEFDLNAERLKLQCESDHCLKLTYHTHTGYMSSELVLNDSTINIFRQFGSHFGLTNQVLTSHLNQALALRRQILGLARTNLNPVQPSTELERATL
jgi:glycosyltransferase involved in cell wall biosynthesis